LLYERKDLTFSGFVLPFLSSFETVIELLLAVAFPVLTKIIVLLLAYCQVQLDVFDQELEWGVDLALPGSAFQVPPIPYLPGMPTQEGPVDMALANP
jgi:hypothetical protein